jgi:hypothetical protein
MNKNKIEKIYINKSIWLQIVKSISVIHIPVLLILVYILNDFISIFTAIIIHVLLTKKSGMCINVIIDIWVISGLSVLFVEEAGVQVKITDVP